MIISNEVLSPWSSEIKSITRVIRVKILELIGMKRLNLCHQFIADIVPQPNIDRSKSSVRPQPLEYPPSADIPDLVALDVHSTKRFVVEESNDEGSHSPITKCVVMDLEGLQLNVLCEGVSDR